MLQHGQQEPVKVRPSKAGRFELVFGERRFRAGKLVDLKELDCVVEQLDDKTADVLRLVENVKRKDLTVFEEAEHLELLHKKHKVPADELAKQVGMSVRSVYEALKLAKLEPAVRKSVTEGKLPVSHAKLISRLEAAEQLECSKHALRYGPVMTHEELEEHIREKYMVDLRGAPFDTKATGMACVAVSCEACPKREGHMCTSTADYAKKVDAHLEALAKATGAKVLDEKKSAKVFSKWGDVMGDAFVKASETKRDDAKQRSYKQLLGKEELKKRTVLAKTPKGDVVELLDTTGLEAALKKEGKFEKSGTSPSFQSSHRETAAQKEKRPEGPGPTRDAGAGRSPGRWTDCRAHREEGSAARAAQA